MCDKETYIFKASGDGNNISDNAVCGERALRFWEIDNLFKCPVVGLCLTFSEQRKILKKAGLFLKDESPFSVHEILVAKAETENNLSLKVDHFLTQKFGAKTALLHGLKEPEFMRRWRTRFNAGQYAEVFWAAVTRPDLSQKAKLEIFGMIHMSMHANVENCARARRQSEYLKCLVMQQEQKMKTMNAARMDLQKGNEDTKTLMSQLKTELLSVKRENDILQNEIDALKTQGRVAEMEAENRLLKMELARKALQINDRDQSINDLKRYSCELCAELEDQKQEISRFRQDAQEAVREFIEMNRCDAACPAFDLCRKRILIVGGIARMEGLYRRLIEDSGGIFEYHDGYMSGGSKQLEVRMKRSDIVLCPVNCNSHAACSLVKNLGKKHNKPVHMLTGFSLSTVYRALFKSGNGETSTQCEADKSDGYGGRI